MNMRYAMEQAGIVSKQKKDTPPPHGQGRADTARKGDEQKSSDDIHPPKTLPEDYVELAEKVIRSLEKKVTTSQLRGILSLASEIYNRESVRTDEDLAPESREGLQMLRVRIVYDAGRDINGGVKDFVEKSELVSYLKGLGGSRKAFLNYYHYMEALIAYHRFLGGKDS